MIEHQLGLAPILIPTYNTDFIETLLNWLSYEFSVPKNALLTRKGGGFKPFRQEVTRIQYCTMTILLEKGFGTKEAAKVFGSLDHTKSITARVNTYYRIAIYESWEVTYNKIKTYVQSISRNYLSVAGEGQDIVPRQGETDSTSESGT